MNDCIKDLPSAVLIKSGLAANLFTTSCPAPTVKSYHLLVSTADGDLNSDHLVN